jgi:hypothetical protein
VPWPAILRFVTPSFFSRLSRYQPALFLDQHENRLTEITAALLEQSALFRDRLIRHLLEDTGDSGSFRAPMAADQLQELRDASASADGASATIATQVPTVGGRFVDLEIEITDHADPASGLLLWIEVKDGADVHGDQLHAYVEEIVGRAAGRSSRVVLLVPSGWEPAIPSAIPPSVLVADWEGVAALAADLAEDDDHLGWLFGEYVEYLKEEGLSETEHRPLDEFSARALMEAESIEDTETALCERAASFLVRDWGPLRIDGGSGQELRSPERDNFWFQFHPAPQDRIAAPTWKEAWFEFTFPATSELDRPELCRAESVFLAGATFHTRDEARGAASQEGWMARLAAEGFSFLRLNGYHRVARLSYPDELLGEKQLDAQARRLADWTLEAFKALAENPPPAP